ncbi:hypothetical protein [Methanoplanus endosymbiosus]|uniref:Uncharacterized protein n=1 Tax=Methanoplanus endosymbiosus TaxID=33865 RepID=A0A9E7PRF5_9EURY|nr:hypothetical protein [Methanoplanus endosymbiosus]UUX92182.1 hypothetical protein L6E24_12610 [Methanoplanus endosymbiosus]
MSAGCLQSQAMENGDNQTPQATPAEEVQTEIPAEVLEPAATEDKTDATEENSDNSSADNETESSESENPESDGLSGAEETPTGELSNSSESNPYLPVVVCENITPAEYRPIWPAGTILSDKKGESKGIITKVDYEQNKYYFRNLILPPEDAMPYLLKDNSFEQMGPVFDSKSIEEKYPGYEGKMMKITIYGNGAIKSEIGYLEYGTKESMKHTSAD